MLSKMPAILAASSAFRCADWQPVSLGLESLPKPPSTLMVGLVYNLDSQHNPGCIPVRGLPFPTLGSGLTSTTQTHARAPSGLARRDRYRPPSTWCGDYHGDLPIKIM